MTDHLRGATKMALAGATPHPHRHLASVMHRAGWSIEWVDLDLTGDAPRLDIRLMRYDGRWLHARVDERGRGTIERWQRRVSLGHPGGRVPSANIVEDTFLGRDRIEGGRPMMRLLCSYLAANALRPVELSDVRRAWAAIMQAPARIEAQP